MVYLVLFWRNEHVLKLYVRTLVSLLSANIKKGGKREKKSRECHNYKPQPFKDTKRKRKQTKPKNANRTNVRKPPRLALSSPNEVIAMLKGQKHKNKIKQGKTQNKSPRIIKKGKRKTQGVQQSQTAALPRHQEEEETNKSKQAQIKQTYEKH